MNATTQHIQERHMAAIKGQVFISLTQQIDHDQDDVLRTTPIGSRWEVTAQYEDGTIQVECDKTGAVIFPSQAALDKDFVPVNIELQCMHCDEHKLTIRYLSESVPNGPGAMHFSGYYAGCSGNFSDCPDTTGIYPTPEEAVAGAIENGAEQGELSHAEALEQIADLNSEKAVLNEALAKAERLLAGMAKQVLLAQDCVANSFEFTEDPVFVTAVEALAQHDFELVTNLSKEMLDAERESNRDPHEKDIPLEKIGLVNGWNATECANWLLEKAKGLQMSKSITQGEVL